MKKIVFALVMLFGAIITHGQDKTRVACIGDSITFGYGIKKRQYNAYPAQLAKKLGKQYKRLKTIFTNAMADLKKKGVSYNIKGILWMQGEQDSKHDKSATEYAQCLKRFYEQLQIDLDAKGVPFVFGQVLPHEPAAARFTHRKELRQSQANAVHDSGHKDAIPNVWMVPTEGMPLKKDTVHYNTEGQLMLGTAYAETMARAQNKKK